MHKMFGTAVRSLVRLGAVAGLAACLASGAQADLINFNATGGTTTTGGYNPGTLQISSLNFGSGDAVAVGAITPGVGLTVGSSFQLYYQTKLVSVNTPSGAVFLNGLNAANGYQITEVSTFREVVTAVSTGPTGTTATFALAPGGANTTKIYFEDLNAPGAVAANAITGQGFNVGQLILTKTVTIDASNYTDTSAPNANMPRVPLNQSGGGGYAGVTTDQGTGSATVSYNVGPYLSNFFASPLTLASFSSNLVNPFKDLAPSNAFNDPTTPTGTPPTIIPVVGANNGTSGPDFLLQISGATESFISVPEPASVAMTVIGLGGLGLGSVVARRRRAGASA